MNLGIICNIENNSPECVIVHNHITGEIGYSTYNEKLSSILEIILDKDLSSQNVLNKNIYYSDCNKNSSYYLNLINEYLPIPYRILWIKKVNDKMDKLLEEGFEILNKNF